MTMVVERLLQVSKRNREWSEIGKVIANEEDKLKTKESSVRKGPWEKN